MTILATIGGLLLVGALAWMLALKVALVSAGSIAAAVYYPTAILQVVPGLLIAVYLYIVVNNARLIK